MTLTLALVCASCAAGSNLPPAATPKTQPQAAARPPSAALATPVEVEAVDAEATNFPYPYPVGFFELRSQGQTLRMAYLDVPPVDAPAAAATQSPATPPPAAAAPAQAPAKAPEQTGDGFDAPAAGVSRAADPGVLPAGQAAPAASPPATPAAAMPAEPARRCAVLLHGKNFSAAAWQSTIDLLTKHGFRVVAPDQIGFGKSSKPGTYQYSFAQLAHNTRALLDSLQLQRCSIVGHSMGGMLAVRFALLYPAATERLILVNPIGLEDYSLFIPYRTVDQWFADELKQNPEAIREYQRTAYYGGSWKPEYDAPMQLVAGFTKHADYPKVAWVNALTTDMIFTQPVVNDLPRLRVPTRLIIGTRDRTALGRKFALPQTAASMGDYTTLGERARDAIPNSQLIELAGLGHIPQVEAFPRYRDALLKSLQ